MGFNSFPVPFAVLMNWPHTLHPETPGKMADNVIDEWSRHSVTELQFEMANLRTEKWFSLLSGFFPCEADKVLGPCVEKYREILGKYIRNGSTISEPFARGMTFVIWKHDWDILADKAFDSEMEKVQRLVGPGADFLGPNVVGFTVDWDNMKDWLKTWAWHYSMHYGSLDGILEKKRICLANIRPGGQQQQQQQPQYHQQSQQQPYHDYGGQPQHVHMNVGMPGMMNVQVSGNPNNPNGPDSVNMNMTGMPSMQMNVQHHGHQQQQQHQQQHHNGGQPQHVNMNFGMPGMMNMQVSGDPNNPNGPDKVNMNMTGTMQMNVQHHGHQQQHQQQQQQYNNGGQPQHVNMNFGMPGMMNMQVSGDPNNPNGPDNVNMNFGGMNMQASGMNQNTHHHHHQQQQPPQGGGNFTMSFGF